MANKANLTWTEFRIYPNTSVEAKAAYAWSEEVGDYLLKLVSHIPKGYYSSFFNDAGAEFDENIRPTLNFHKPHNASNKITVLHNGELWQFGPQYEYPPFMGKPVAIHGYNPQFIIPEVRQMHTIDYNRPIIQTLLK